MPTLEIDFEVFCATCGDGLCNKTDVREGRRYPQVRVEACPKCMKGKDDEIKLLEKRIEYLESKLEAL